MILNFEKISIRKNCHRSTLQQKFKVKKILLNHVEKSINIIMMLRVDCATHQPCSPFSEASRIPCWTNRETSGDPPVYFPPPFPFSSFSVLSNFSLSTLLSSSGLRAFFD